MSNANLVMRFQADSTDLVRELQRVDERLNTFQSSAQKIGAGFKTFIGGAAVTAAVALTKSAIAAGQELDNLSRVAGSTTGEFQRYAAAAKSLGIDQEKLSDIFKDVNDKIGDFIQTGAGPMVDFFENIAPKVGVTAEQFRNLSGPQALGLYVDSLKKANVNQQDMTFYMEAIASDATALIPIFADNNKLLNEQGELAERLGTVLTDLEVKNLKDANVAVNTLTGAVGKLGQAFIADLAPYITTAANKMTEFLATLVSGQESTAALEMKLAELESKKFFGRSAKASRERAQQEINELKDKISLQKALSGDADSYDRARELMGARLVELKDAQLDADSKIGRMGRSRRAELQEEIAEVEGYLARLQEMPSTVADQATAPTQIGPSLEGEQTGEPLTRVLGGAPEDVLERLRTHLASEDEVLFESFMARKEQLDAFLENKLVSEDEYNDLSLKSVQKYNEQRAALSKKSSNQVWNEEQKLRRDTLSATAQFFGVMASENKAFAVGQALINTYLGVSQSLAAYPMPLAAIMAATHLAAGLQNLQAIKSGGGGGGGGGSVPAATGASFATGSEITPVSEQINDEPKQKTVRVVIEGDAELIPRETVRSIAEQINELQESNVKLVV